MRPTGGGAFDLLDIGPPPSDADAAALLSGAAQPAPPPPQAYTLERAATPASLASPRAGSLSAPLALVLAVELGDGRSASLEVRVGDDADTVAAEFCAAHGLPLRVLGPLAERIRAALAPPPQTADDFFEPPAAARAQPRAQSASPALTERPAAVAGERLYREGLARRRAQERSAAAQRAAREQAELAECQTGPVITALARSLPRPEPAWRRLAALAPGPERELELYRLKQERAERELEACTFAPAVSARSEALMHGRAAAMRAAGVTAHATLYADAQRRAARAAEYAQWLPEDATFAPAVHASGPTPAYRDYDDDGGSYDEDDPAYWEQQRSGDVVERLWDAGRRYEEHAAAVAAEAARRDLTTGRPMFTPATGRAPSPSFARDVDAAHPVHAHLYEQRRVAEHKRALLEASLQREADAARAGASARSAALTAQRRRRRFGHIFHALDARGAGALDMWAAAADAAATLHPEIAADVELAAHLAPPSGPVDEPLFCDLMEEAVRASNTGPRGYLAASVALRGQADDGGAPSFAPQLDVNSRALAARRRPAGVPVHVALAREAAAAERRLQQAVVRRDAEELAPCTFAPTMVGVPPPPRPPPSGPVPWDSLRVRSSRVPARAPPPAQQAQQHSEPDSAAEQERRRFADLAFDIAGVVAQRAEESPDASADWEEMGPPDASLVEAGERVRARLAALSA